MLNRRSLLIVLILVALAFNLPQPVHSQGPDSDVANWLDAHVIPLDTTEPGHGYADLMLLKDLIGDAPIVALGEATHGTHEFFTMKHRMVEFLVQELGFTIFAMEANWPEAERINHYVHTGEGDPAELLAGIYFWTWNTQEVLDLIEWIRSYNQTVDADSRVTFTGFDAQILDLALENVIAYLRDVSPGDVEQVLENYTCLETYNLTGVPVMAAITAYQELPLEESQACGDSVQAAYEFLAQQQRRLVAASSEYAYTTALHNALTVVQVEEVLALRYTSGSNPRDRYMAENVSWLLERGGPEAKIILWAHNGHISRLHNSGMGGWLDRQYGDDYLTFGFAFDHGSFNAVVPRDDQTEQFGDLVAVEVDPAPEESIESFLRQATNPDFILDVRDVDYGEPGAKWLRSVRLLRSLGAVYDPSASHNYFWRATLEVMYDFVIFVEETTAAESFEMTAE